MHQLLNACKHSVKFFHQKLNVIKKKTLSSNQIFEDKKRTDNENNNNFKQRNLINCSSTKSIPLNWRQIKTPTNKNNDHRFYQKKNKKSFPAIPKRYDIKHDSTMNKIIDYFFVSNSFFGIDVADNILYSGEEMRQNFEIGAKGRTKYM